MDGHLEDQYKSVSDFYDGKSIFMTGGSGFLGKVFLEKILYRCQRIAKVYVLIRNTEKMSAQEKMRKMLECPIFNRLRDERPQDLSKVVLIAGDISEPNLGISAEDEKLLTENVSMVFHFAATVRFNEPLQVAVNLNVEGTRRILELCQRMKNLQVFLYVSTAFSNAKRAVIEEVVYPPPIPLNKIDEIIEKGKFTAEKTKEILNGLPNTYTLTKAIAESLVLKYNEQYGIPTIIVRPSIVIACKDEPLSGWIDNWFGASALATAVSKALVRVLLADGENTIDFIPADYVANVIAVAAARCKRSQNVEVYNSCSSVVNPITLRQLGKLITKDSLEHKFNLLPMPGLIFIQMRWLAAIVIFLLETLPIYLADLAMRIIGRRTAGSGRG